MCLLCRRTFHYSLQHLQSQNRKWATNLRGKKKLCFNCLGFHPISNCRSDRRCIICNKQHHTLLHEDISTSSHVTPIHNHIAIPAPSFVSNSELRLTLVAQSSSVQLAIQATALAKLRGADGKMHTARAMIDPGSQSSFVSEVLLKKLQQPYSASTIPLTGIGGYSHIPLVTQPYNLSLLSTLKQICMWMHWCFPLLPSTHTDSITQRMPGPI